MEEIEAVLTEFRDVLIAEMVEEGIEPTVEERIKFLEEMIEYFKEADDLPKLMKRIIVTMFEVEIEDLQMQLPVQG